MAGKDHPIISPINDSYQDISLEKFRLYDNENDMIYEGDYSGLGILKK
jgi:hypothetical protein